MIPASILLIALTITTLWANSADDRLMVFSYFSQKIDFDISKCQSLFSGRNMKKYFKMLSAEIFTCHAKW